jgi:hypothetical protein
VETIAGRHSIDSVQQTAVLGTSHIIRRVMQCEAGRLSGGDHRWFKSRSSRENRRVARDNNNNKYENNNVDTNLELFH